MRKKGEFRGFFIRLEREFQGTKNSEKTVKFILIFLSIAGLANGSTGLTSEPKKEGDNNETVG
ncbi:hypothetical protein DOT36_08940 [Vibrio vulnificus]|uniref:Uncharacterized protein n=1 Tax=Vibrio vulnificus TaxID=672 RepID=A0A2S3R4K6_VIBVL|nr:hypothetical protein CRN52_08665 [Vibrio vulnificus]RAH27675.1 hypothetical protein DOT36_08940 [Vibrio vulnificus]